LGGHAILRMVLTNALGVPRTYDVSRYARLSSYISMNTGRYGAPGTAWVAATAEGRLI
jgi:hypothetical protein